MVHPLVRDNERALSIGQMGDGILGEDCKAVGGDELRNTMVDLRVYMVRTAGQHDAVAVMLL